MLPENIDPVVLGGTGNPGWRVDVIGTRSGTDLCTSTVDARGTWSCEVNKKLGPGTATFTVSQASPDEATVSVGIEHNIHIGSYTPATVTSPTMTSPGAAAAPVFAGTGEPGLDVVVTGNSGKRLSTARVGADRRWSGVSAVTLSVGEYISYVQQSTDPATRITYRIAASSVTSPAIDGYVVTDGADGETATATFSGSTESHTGVTVTSSSSAVLCTAASSETGAWSCASTGLVRGAHLGSVQPDIAGAAATGFAFTVVTRASVTSPVDGDVVSAARPTFAGTAEPDTTVEIVGSSGRTLCTATASADGNWDCTVGDDLGTGDYVYTLRQRVGDTTVFTGDRLTYTIAREGHPSTGTGTGRTGWWQAR